MGKIECIRNAISPLKEAFLSNEITYYADDDCFEVFLRQPQIGNWELLFHMDERYRLNLYFLLRPGTASPPGIPGVQDLKTGSGMVVFSGVNVFRFFSIPYHYEVRDHISGLYELSTAIRDNANEVLGCSTGEHLERTCAALMELEGNEEKLQETVKGILE